MKNRLALLRRLRGPVIGFTGVILLLMIINMGEMYAQTGETYQLTWWTIDSGGSGGGVDNNKRVTGGSYELLSTVGQPDAAAAIVGGEYTLYSGFWPGTVSRFNIYVPILLKQYPPPPDLVGSFTLSPPGPDFNAGTPVTINVQVTNQGDTPATGFWVDFYINPSDTPRVNYRWNDLCSMDPCYGLAWYVPGLEAGQSISLSSKNFMTDYSRWPGYFASGTTYLYLYVDSWNPSVSYGGVYELNEANNLYTYPDHVTVTGLTPAGITGDANDLSFRPAWLPQK